MRKLFLLPVIMGLFDGGAAGATAGAAAGGAAPAAGDGAGAQGETKGAARGDASRGNQKSPSGGSRRDPGESSTANVRYGKQTDAAEGEQVQQGDAGAAETEEDLHAQFLELVNGKYKNAYTAETQKIIDRRYGQMKNTAAKEAEQRLEATRPVVDMLMQRYNITDGDMQKLFEAVAGDDPTLANRAEKNGMSVEQQRIMDKLERENAALRQQEQSRARAAMAQETTNKWLAEAAALKGTSDKPGKYPNFDLRTEATNPEFLNLLRAGIPMEHAYEVLHRDEINNHLIESTAVSTEKRVVDNIRSQGMRPRENGTSSQGSFITKSDPRQLTKEDHKAIRERVRRGEKIVF